MPWIKRNLFLVIGGVIALALLGFAGYFTFNQRAQDQFVTAQLNEQTEKLKQLVNRNPHPGNDQVDNIAAAQQELKRLNEFAARVKEFFPPPSVPTNLGNKEFRVLLDNTVNELQINAEKAGVDLPDDYWFSFSAQQKLMNFRAEDLQPLAGQIAEVRAICNTLFDAKILRLENVKRAQISKDDTGGQDYVTAKGVTNEWAVVMPYEVTFHAFSSELEGALAGLIKSPECLIVKAVAVDRAPAADAMAPAGGYGYPGGMNPYTQRYGPGSSGAAMRDRYGVGGRYSAPQPQFAPPPVMQRAPGRDGTTTILEEKPLRITLTIESVKLKAEKKST